MNMFKIFDKFIAKGSRDLIYDNNKKYLFRELTKRETLSTLVYDYRNLMSGYPNNNIILTCEHASNNIYNIKTKDEKEKAILDTHWGYDPGSKDFGLELSEKAEIFSIYSNFSRLILDPNRSIISQTLIRDTVEKNVKLSFNEDSNLCLFY
jgi:predicted N-formylglutamate amidohydrolase